jgi:hypothetical protein
MTTEDPSKNNSAEHNLCHVCGIGDDGRRLCHFVPNDDFPEEIFLHVFCGKTAAILPNVNRPDLEILTKAGVKNKHGTGVSVTLALQRCRSARVSDPSNREQEYFLSKEFERIFMAATTTEQSHHPENLQEDVLQLREMSILQSQAEANTIFSHEVAMLETSSISPGSLDYLPRHNNVNTVGTATEIISASNDANHHTSKRHKSNAVKSPYEIEMENLQHVCDRCSGVGYSLIRGVARESRDNEGDEISEDDDFNPNECSQEQVNHVRVIIITKERQERMEEMSILILGDQHGKKFMMFDTNFSYQVINAWNSFTFRFREALDWKEKFDLLLGFTDTLKEHDVWMCDHEIGWGGEKMVEQLAKSWKLMLERDNEQLGIDPEYTRPGVIALLEQFKEAVESVDTDPDDRMIFDFEA